REHGAEGPAPSRAVLAWAFLMLLPALAGAQSYAPAAPAPLPLAVAPLAIKGPYDSTIRLEVANRIRGEFVDWFATPQGGPTPNYRYNFLGNKFQLGVRVTKDPYELFVQFQDSTLANIPDNGIGIGSIYYANTARSLQNGTILRNAWIGTKRLFDQPISGRAGRLLYSDGLDAQATAPNLKWIQLNRLSQRLIGPFDYTHVGRSFDGGHVGYDTELFNFTGFGFVPTYGGFEVDANRQLDITLGGGAVNLKESTVLGPTIARLFWYYYGDHRDVLFLDNRPLEVRRAEIGEPAEISTVGAHIVRLEPLGPGIADAMAYGFGQFGEWQSLTQRAWAYGVELGYRLPDVWAKPWMRTGINSGSGDTNPDDNIHGTFFQMLPTAWLYAQFPFYNMMNNQDVFVQWIADPHPMLNLRLDLHWLRLNSSRDFSYFGGGATKNDFFGYGGVNGQGRSELAYLTHLMMSVRPTAFLTVNAFYAHAFGQGVINAAFEGRGGNYGFLEMLLAF
ncbi:MAG: alginate export family protein, partial [Candidatus Binatia bacterium]